MVATSHQFFLHSYLAQLQAAPSHEETATSIVQGLRNWIPSHDASSLQAMSDSWVGPALDFLESYHTPADDAPYVRLLYAHRGDETPLGPCYVFPSGQGGSTSSPRSLDDTTKGQCTMAQPVQALRWGMLSDSAHWWLVDAQPLRCHENYVKLNLNELAHSDAPRPPRLFYTFFCHRALTYADNGESGLNRLVATPAQATDAAEDHLKARVSHNKGIMAQLCLGLVHADGQARYTKVVRNAIYRDTTRPLHRVLFIFYAEVQGLLPVEKPAYRTVNLTGLVWIAYAYKWCGIPIPKATTLWDQLKRLCTIVRQIVWRRLKERRAPLEEKLIGWLEEIAATTDPNERACMQHTADEGLLRLVEDPVLTFRVCDPTVGNNHFLVNTARQMTAFIVETLHLTPWENAGIDADPIAWQRRAMEHHLYGVGLSMMTVKLAKLNLWLTSVAEAKPLSFLDDHLHQGNNLIGVQLEDLTEVLTETTSASPSRREREVREVGQLSMLDHPTFRRHVTAATDLLVQISSRVAETVEDVKAQEADYERARAELKPYRLVADFLRTVMHWPSPSTTCRRAPLSEGWWTN